MTWKDIAAYPKCSVRKAQRLESQGLPINRMSGAKSVWALKPAIDEWMMAQAEKARSGEDRWPQSVPLAGSGLRQTAALSYGSLAAVGIPAAVTIAAAMASAYGLTIVSFALTAAVVVWIYPRLADTSYTRAAVALFMVAGMA